MVNGSDLSKPSDLDHAVQQAIKAGGIGQPVFVRCLLGMRDNRAEQLDSFVDAILTIQAWIGAEADLLYVVGSWDRAISVFARFRTGATSVISAVGGEGINSDVIVLGNHGAIYLDGVAARQNKLASAVLDSDAKRLVRSAIERAVESGEPQRVSEPTR